MFFWSRWVALFTFGRVVVIKSGIERYTIQEFKFMPEIDVYATFSSKYWFCGIKEWNI